jgi:hypothetical protein
MSKRGVNMVTKDEQTEFFNTIFAPLRMRNVSKIKLKKASDFANEFFEGKRLKQSNLEFKDWNTTSLSETESTSWNWLIGMRKAYPELKRHGIKVHKFVWHKKQNEAGWGPKVVIKEGKVGRREFQYITKPMEEKRELEIRKVGSEFNLFQPPQQDYDHEVWSHGINGTTTFKVLAEKGKTLGEVFDDYIKEEEFPKLKNLFDKIIRLYLQREIETLPSIGFVDAQKPSGKNKKNNKSNWLKDLKNIEKETPFLIPLRWIGSKNEECISILHGDEWGGNFIAPINPDAGSVRPIDFEDAHIQGVEVVLDLENNILSYIKPTKNTHRTGSGDLAYRPSGSWNSWKKGDPPPLHAYSAMSALGRLFAALVQKRTDMPFLEHDDTWIEIVTARFFHCLRTEVEKCLTSSEGGNLLKKLKLNRELIQRGLMARVVLATYNWSNYWKYKDRDTNEDDQYFIGKWKKSSLEEFQFQLRIQGEWESLKLDEKGRPSTYAQDYVSILKTEHDLALEGSQEREDLNKCMAYIEKKSKTNEGRVPDYSELTMLSNIVMEPKILLFNNLEFYSAETSHPRLREKICIIYAHLIAHYSEFDINKLNAQQKNFLKKLTQDLEKGDYPEDISNDIHALLDGGITFANLNKGNSANFQRRSEAWSIGPYLDITDALNYAQMGNISRTKKVLEIFQQHRDFYRAFRSRWRLTSQESPKLIDSTIIQLAHQLSNWLYEFFSSKSSPPLHQSNDIKLLTEIVKTINFDDKDDVELKRRTKVLIQILFCLNEIKFKQTEFDEFVEFLGPSIKKSMANCIKDPRGNQKMDNIVNLISNSNHQLIREWAIEFRRKGISKEAWKLHEKERWSKKWSSMR